MPKLSKKKIKNTKYRSIKSKNIKITNSELTKQGIKIFWNHKLSRSTVGCSTFDLIKNLGIKCDVAPVTGRGLLSYEKHLFPEINVFTYLKNKNFLDVGCGINHIYNKSLLYKLQKKNYNSTGLDLYKFPKTYKNFKSGSILNTGLKSNEYDVITSQYFLYYWMDNTKDLLKAYQEMKRLLKKNGEIRIYPVYFGNFHYNDEKLIDYLFSNFDIEVKYPKFYPEKVGYIYPGEGEKDIKTTDSGTPRREKRDAERLMASVVICKIK